MEKIRFHFFPTGDKNTHEYFRELCENGFHQRYGDNPSDIAKERYEFELDIIQRMGFESYFLIVHDFINFAKIMA